MVATSRNTFAARDFFLVKNGGLVGFTIFRFEAGLVQFCVLVVSPDLPVFISGELCPTELAVLLILFCPWQFLFSTLLSSRHEMNAVV